MLESILSPIIPSLPLTNTETYDLRTEKEGKRPTKLYIGQSLYGFRFPDTQNSIRVFALPEKDFYAPSSVKYLSKVLEHR